LEKNWQCSGNDVLGQDHEKKLHIVDRGSAKTKLDCMGTQLCTLIYSPMFGAPTQVQNSTVTDINPLVVIPSSVVVRP
jgi:hypothetical protein